MKWAPLHAATVAIWALNAIHFYPDSMLYSGASAFMASVSAAIFIGYAYGGFDG